MQILIDDTKLNLLLEQKKKYIGKKVAWDSFLSALSFLVGVAFASYENTFIIPGVVLKTIFTVLGIFFTGKSIFDIHNSIHNSYSYTDLLQDINKLNEITHNHSIVAIQDTFNEYPNRFLVYDDPQWQCQLFINYKDNENNESFIKDHVSRELKVDISSITVKYISKIISQKVSGRDNKEKVYCHKLFLVKLKDIPAHMRNDTFECNRRTYHWQSILDLENNNAAIEKNSDIIRFVKENI